MSRLLQIGIAGSQLLNTLLGGEHDEAFSARCWRMRHRQPFTLTVAVIDGFFFWQDAHCKASYEAEKRRRQLPRDYSDAKSICP